MEFTNKHKILLSFGIGVVVLILLHECMVAGVRENMDPSTAEWVDSPTDIVMPSVNMEAITNNTVPPYVPQVKVADEPKCSNDSLTKSHLIFKDGIVPRDYLPGSNDVMPEEVMNSSELLPADDNNTWSDVNPKGTGSIAYKNFLDVGHHIGQINVLRNANLDIRAEFPVPTFTVGPWQQSTIQPNIHANNSADLCA